MSAKTWPVGCAVLVFGIWALGPADPAASQPPAAAVAAAAPAAEAKAPSPEELDKLLREQSIYIPYDKLRQVFEKQGRGVFLPYDKFDELWKAARQHAKPAAEPKPPVGALVSEINSEATVEKDVVKVKAKLKIEVLAEGWNEIPLRLSDAAIASATVGGQPARLLGAEGQSYRLLVEKKGKTPEQIELQLEYAKAITRMPGQNSVSFQAPQAPVNVWKVTIPQAGVKVSFQPLLAATEGPPKEKKPGDKKDEETTLLAFVGAAPAVRIDWTPKAEGALGMAAMASVQADQQVFVNEGVVRTRAVLNYTISRAELGQLTLDVPEDQKVVNVFDANVRKWGVEEGQGRKRITAELYEPAKAAQQVTVELEKYVEDKPRQTVAAPVVQAVDVGRQQGVVVVAVGEGLRAEAGKTSANLLQVDSGDLPAALKIASWAFAYRYAGVPFELALEVEKVQPRITADSLVEVYLEPERLTMDLTAVFTVERSGVFRLELDKPAGYQVRQVRGRELPGVAAAQVDTWHEEGEKKTRLVVNLSRKAKDKVGLLIELQQDLGQRELLTQPGKTADIPIEVPTVPTAPGGIAERATGRLVIYAPESLQVNPGKPAGLGEAPLEKAMENIPSARDAKPGNARPVLPYTFAQEAVKLGLSVERRKPDVKIYQLLVARIDAGVVRYEAGLNYEVLYSGVKSLRLDVPADVTAALRNETSGVEKTPFDPQPDDVDKDYVALRFTAANKEFFGKGRIDLVIEQKLDEPGAKGKAAAAGLALKVPVLKPRQVERAWGHLVIAKAEALDVIAPAKLDGLQPKDPHKDLPAPVTGAAQAFEFQDKWSLTLNVRQYELEDVKRTSIERGVVRMVVTPAGEVTVQALYRMRSARQRLELKLDGKVEFAAMPLRIDGKAVSLEKDPTGQYFIPLTDSNPERPFLLELHYTTPGDGRDLALPVFPQESAVLKVYLCAYLPNDRVLMGAAGPWTEEFRWWLDQSLTWRPVPRLVDNQQLNDKQLLRWVAEGVQVAGDPADRLQPQGSLYTYSTLRPAEKGRLDLRTMNKNLLHALVFIAAVLGGVLLLPTGLAGRAAAIGAAVVAIVLAGVFLPTAAMQILDGVFLSAVFVVLVLWVVWYFVRTRPRWAAERAAAAAQAPVAPVVVGPQTPTKPLGGLGAGIDLTKQPPPADAPKPEAAPPPADTAPPSPPAGTGEGGPSHG